MDYRRARMFRALRIAPVLRDYDWGTRDFIPDLLGAPRGGPIAEAWYGAHSSGPSVALDEAETPLDRLIEQRAREALGARVAARFGRLPFLLKLLSAARPLSIQVHPSKGQAKDGFARRQARPDAPSSYQDDNHKPELLVALTPFYALCGFRDLAEIAQDLTQVGELSALLPRASAEGEWLRSLISAYYALDEAPRERALGAWLEQLASTRPSPGQWQHFALEAHRTFSRPGATDPGLFFFVLLNFVRLEPGQGLYLDAGTPHAYLLGSGVEVMANSDNVLRGGLTNKPVDVPELLRVMRFDATPPSIVSPNRQRDEATYITSAVEFQLSRIALEPGLDVSRTSDGPELLLVESGPAAWTDADVSLELAPGQACFVPSGVTYRLSAPATAKIVRVVVPDERVQTIRANIAEAERLFRSKRAAPVLGCVCGSGPATRFWQRRLEDAQGRWGARSVLALHEDLPVNQAFGVLLAWKRLEPRLAPGEGALLSFVFGEGTRATPFTETDNGQKPAMASFVRSTGGSARYLPMAELALRHFAPVEAHLRRSGFDGVVIKWGDEVQIPSRDLGGTNASFKDADVVRFVSLRPINDDDARNKDWVGVDADGRVTSFIPRRPLEAMHELADRGVLRREGDQLIGGINLGSIAISKRLLTLLLEEFDAEVVDSTARRADRPDLDPQFFTALTTACIEDEAARSEAWSRAQQETPSLAELARKMPDLASRLVRVVHEFRTRYGQPPRIVAMDFGEPYWGDIGQHRQIREFYQALLDRGPNGVVSRALADIGDDFDAHGNLIVDSTLPENALVRNSVLINCQVSEACDVRNGVLIGTRCRVVRCDGGFDVDSCVGSLELSENAGSYKVVDPGHVRVAAKERLTSLFLGLPEHPDPVMLRVSEATDLKARSENYEAPVLDNPISFARAHEAAVALDPEKSSQQREEAVARVLERIQ
jgi:mannose-6-phosphate isomerase class I